MARARKRRDVALVYGMTEDQGGYKILRQRGARGPIEAGVVLPLREGQNIVGEVVKLTPRKNAPLFFDVNVEMSAEETGQALAPPAAEATETTHPGPANVSSKEYRSGWDAIWGTMRGGRVRSSPN